MNTCHACGRTGTCQLFRDAVVWCTGKTTDALDSRWRFIARVNTCLGIRNVFQPFPEGAWALLTREEQEECLFYLQTHTDMPPGWIMWSPAEVAEYRRMHGMAPIHTVVQAVKPKASEPENRFQDP